jgi:hypothetical protein
MVQRFVHRFRRRTPDERPSAAAQPAASPPPPDRPPAPTQAVSPDDLANAAIERLAEDEALRGDLTDDGFLPLQNWAFARLQRIAHEAAHHPDPQAAMDGYTSQIRAFAQAAVQAAENKALGDLAGQVKPRVVLAKDVPAVADALRHLTFTDDADANAQAIAAALTPSAED